MKTGRRTDLIIVSIVAAAFIGIIWYQRSGSGYNWEKDLESRVALDFTKTRAEVTEEVKQYLPDVTDSQLDEWTADGRLEGRMINGEMKYFVRAARNLFRIDTSLTAVYDSVKAAAEGMSLAEYRATDDYIGMKQLDLLDNIPEIIAGAKESGKAIAAPKKMKVRYTLTVKEGAVPDGEMISCWLPFPRKDVARQTDVKFIKAGVIHTDDGKTEDQEKVYEDPSEEGKWFCLSGDRSEHSTVFMKSSAIKGKKTIFYEEFEYTSAGEWYNLDSIEVKPYDKESDLYKTYTAERGRHVIFTSELKELAEKITEGIESPVEQAKAIYNWIDPTPWASALEYSTMENIPMYVYTYHHGDCGMQSLLFITLCRIKGIPAHFQSGFMMHPGAWNMHDWAEIWFEGVGWVPVDMSFGRQTCNKDGWLDRNPEAEHFFLGGIDSWRMVVNSDFGKNLYPEKKYPRSETVDFQRGEVEWADGNLYFDKWSWDMDIEYL